MTQWRSRSLPKVTMIPAGHAAGSLHKLMPRKVVWKAPSHIIRSLSDAASDYKQEHHACMDEESKELVRSIKSATFLLNKNNLTRTAAYLAFFKSYKEIEWAFLAHMVSRNAGYYMTDLKGEFIPRLMCENERNRWFLFLEHSNYMIFHDAYPQLLLYAESKKRKKALFHLLPYFGVSKLMVSVWNTFFTNRKYRKLLTVFLIINEQNYIEERIVKSIDHGMLLQSSSFKWQEILHFSQIVLSDGKKLYGAVAKKFGIWKERVSLGSALYAILFSPEKFQSFLQYAVNVPHTGSRADCVSHIFSPDGTPEACYLKERLRFFSLKKGASHLFSPSLVSAWPQTERPFIKNEDWYRDMNEIKDCLTITRPSWQQAHTSYYSSLHKLELTVLAHEWIKLQKK
ncbi:DUF2515 family protein [Fictibacillus iocasae]|uniref:DUF2515 family protein n=1 Tax=Fictibacillus iocasae TaxID=2715437 RepID=A0ABW2NN62_9BACL